MNMTTSETEINGIAIHYRVYGEGEPLLLIIGLGGNADWWDRKFLEPLAQRFKVITFDNRGAGRSGRPEGPYPVSLMASDTVGLMDHLGLESADVLGISMGGMIAQELACTYPERVRRLALLCTNCGGREQVFCAPEVYALLTMPREGLTQEDIMKVSLYFLFPPEYIEESSYRIDEVLEDFLIAPTEPRCFMAQLNGVSRWSIFSRLSGLRHPTLIIAGGRDILIPPENSRILADAIPNSRLVEIPGGGHAITSMFPEKVAQEVLDFLT